jgi:hypothetical protein
MRTNGVGTQRGHIADIARCIEPQQPLSSAAELHWYREALQALERARVPFLVGGAFALWKYTGVRRPTKDLDIFLCGKDMPRALSVLRHEGCRTEITARHWLGKAHYKDFFIDLITGLANGVSEVDASWFETPVRAELFGAPFPFVSPEDMIWAKAFVMERERFDGADIAHLLLAQGPRLDWRWIARRFEKYPLVLLSHLSLFAFIYPQAADIVPGWLRRQLFQSWMRPRSARRPVPLCNGTLFSRTQYAPDVERCGFIDARLRPYGRLTPRQILE